MQQKPDIAFEKVHKYMDQAKLHLQSASVIEVQEYFGSPTELLVRLAWDAGIDSYEHKDLSAYVTSIMDIRPTALRSADSRYGTSGQGCV